MKHIQRFWESKPARAAAGMAALLALAVLLYSTSDFLGSTSAAKLSRQAIFIDATTGQPFHHEIQPGDKIPITAPSGGSSGYPAEMCYWTAEGKLRSEPFPVLLNRYAGKTGPTFCPDCGRLVTAQRPPPMPGEEPPPTAEAYKRRPIDLES